MATATQTMESASRQNNGSGEDVNYAKEKQDGEFLCRIQNWRCEAYVYSDAYWYSHYCPTEVSEEGINKKEPGVESREAECCSRGLRTYGIGDFEINEDERLVWLR
jgi:hypothetical protein